MTPKAIFRWLRGKYRLDDDTRRALSDKGIAFGFQEAADVAREMGSDAIADALRAEGIKRYAALAADLAEVPR
jgi:hypothetical protein